MSAPHDLRDYFAGQALAGMWANPSVVYQQPDFTQEGGRDDLATMARDAYAIADAMLAARTKVPAFKPDTCTECGGHGGHIYPCSRFDWSESKP